MFSFTLKCWNCILGDDGEKRTKTSACYFKLMIKIIIITNCLVIKIENMCFFHVNKTYLSWDNKILNSQSQDTIKSLWTQTWKRKMLNSSFRFRWLLFCHHIFNVIDLYRNQKTFIFNKQLTSLNYFFNLQKFECFWYF